MKLQIILDTNVLVAAFRSKRGAANRLVQILDDNRWQVNVSTSLSLEYEDVLKRPEMSPYISSNAVDEILESLSILAVRRDIFFLWRLFVRDPNDALLFELAVRTASDYLITFNKKDFQNLPKFGVKLATPREFLKDMGELS